MTCTLKRHDWRTVLDPPPSLQIVTVRPLPSGKLFASAKPLPALASCEHTCVEPAVDREFQTRDAARTGPVA
jgi:hypothetical protein